MERVAFKLELDDRHLDAWRDEVCDQMLDAESPIPASASLGVKLGVTAVAGVVHLDCRTTRRGLVLARSPARIARGGIEVMGLSVVTSGEAEIETGTGTHVVRAGELCMLSSLQPFTKQLSDNYHEQFLYLPVPTVLALGRKTPVMNQRILVAQRRGLGALLADSVRAMASSSNELTMAEWNTALGAIFELAAGVFGTPDPERLSSTTREVHRERALRHIDANLGDPALSPRGIAGALGVSLRYLHGVFEGSESVGATILMRRLDRCRTVIVDPAERHRSISEIAYHWGFNDAAHFSRTFKARFGVSPRGLRAHVTR
jgi:AraC-like DNA-binding protein